MTKLQLANKEIERLQSIIKEAREYLYKIEFEEPSNSREYIHYIEHLGKILDKENK